MLRWHCAAVITATILAGIGRDRLARERVVTRVLILSGTFAKRFLAQLKELDPIPQFQATAKLGRFLEAVTADICM